MVQAPRPNAGRREKSRENDLFSGGKKNYLKKIFFFCIYLLEEEEEEKKRKKKVGENNGQLRFVRHHVWRTQANLDQNLPFTLMDQVLKFKFWRWKVVVE